MNEQPLDPHDEPDKEGFVEHVRVIPKWKPVEGLPETPTPIVLTEAEEKILAEDAELAESFLPLVVEALDEDERPRPWTKEKAMAMHPSNRDHKLSAAQKTKMDILDKAYTHAMAALREWNEFIEWFSVTDPNLDLAEITREIEGQVGRIEHRRNG